MVKLDKFETLRLAIRNSQLTQFWCQGVPVNYGLNAFYKADGSLKKMYVGALDEISQSMNELNLSLIHND